MGSQSQPCLGFLGTEYCECVQTPVPWCTASRGFPFYTPRWRGPTSLLVKALLGHRIPDRSGIGIHMLFNFLARRAILWLLQVPPTPKLQSFALLSIITYRLHWHHTFTPGFYHGTHLAIPASFSCPCTSAARRPFLSQINATIAAVGLAAAYIPSSWLLYSELCEPVVFLFFLSLIDQD